MKLSLITGLAGSGKSFSAAERIKKAADAGERVYVIVPDQFNFEYCKLLYKYMGAESFNSVDVCQFRRLAEDIFAASGVKSGQSADDTVKTAVMFRALQKLCRERSLKFYAHQAEKGKFTSDALSFVKTFRANSIQPEMLEEKLSAVPDDMEDKLRDVSLIYSTFSKMMSESGFKDADSSVSDAARIAAEVRFFDGAHIFIDEFRNFTYDQYKIISAMLSDAAELTVCLTTDGESTVFATPEDTSRRLRKLASERGAEIALTVLTDNHRFKSDMLRHVSNNILRIPAKPFEGEKDGSFSVYRAADAYEEADFVFSRIRHLITEEGFRCSEIAILTREKAKYSSIFDAAAKRCGVPLFNDTADSISHKALTAFVCTAMNLAAKKTPSTEDWLRYVKTGFTGLELVSAGALEDYCIKWNVEGKMWAEPFRIFDSYKKTNNENEEPDRFDSCDLEGAQTSRLSADEVAEDSRRIVTEPINALREAAEKLGNELTVGEICRLIFDFFREIKLKEIIDQKTAPFVMDNVKRENAAAASTEYKSFLDADTAASMREVRQLWNIICTLFADISRSAESAADGKMSLREFSNLFALAASRQTISAPPQALDAVSFSPSETARLANPRAVFVIGANEGVFPFAAVPSPLLSSSEISALRDCGINIEGDSVERMNDEYFTVYSSVSAASELLCVTFPSASVDGSPLYPASALSAAAELFGGEVKSVADLLKNEEYFCVTKDNAYYHYVQGYRRGGKVSASIRAALEDDEECRTKFGYLDKLSRRHGGYTLSPKMAEALYGNKISLSASCFEDFEKCPFVYFCKKGLNISKPKRVIIDSMMRGNIIHYCLQEFICAHKNDISSVTDDAIAADIRSILDGYFAGDEIGGEYGKTKKFLCEYEHFNVTLCDIIKRLRDEFKCSEFRPDSCEYKIGTVGGKCDEPAPIFDLGDGKTAAFTGSVDRIDLCRSKNSNGEDVVYVRVIDYKSGTKNFRMENVYYGIDMQMLLYIFEITANGRYSSCVPAGILYMPATDISCCNDRKSSEKSNPVDKAKDSTYKMKGAVREGDEIIALMESERKGKFIPVDFTKQGDISAKSKVIYDSRFKELRDDVIGRFTDAGRQIAGGNVNASPICENAEKKDSWSCCYCDYKSICGYPNVIPRDKQKSKGSAKEFSDKYMYKKPKEDKL